MSDQLKDLLDAWVDREPLSGATALLERAEQQLADSDIVHVPAIDRAPQSRRFSRWDAGAVVAAMLIVIIGGVTLLVRTGPIREPASPTPASTVVPEPPVIDGSPEIVEPPIIDESMVVDRSPVVVTPPVPEGSWLEVAGWNSYIRGDRGLSTSTSVLWDVAATGSGLVAVGVYLGTGTRDGRRPDGKMWTSADGIAWVVTADDQDSLSQGAVHPLAVVDIGSRMVAVGAACDDPERSCPVRPAVWTSDDGAIWTRVPHQATVFGSVGGMHDVIVTDAGVMAVGTVCDARSCQPAVWTSPDGLNWTRTWVGAATDLGPFLRRDPTQSVSLADQIDPDVFVEGVPFLEDGAGLLVESWNGDGIRTQVAYPHMRSVVVGPDGLLVAVGVACDDATTCAAAVWTAADANKWERIPHDTVVFQDKTSMHSVAFGASGFVAVGAQQNGGVVWTSLDGHTWAEVPGRRGTFASATLSDVVVWGSGYVAVGNHPVGGPRICCPKVPVWVSPDGQSWSTTTELGAFHLLSVTAGGPGIVVVGGTGDGGLPMAGIYVASKDLIPIRDP